MRRVTARGAGVVALALALTLIPGGLVASAQSPTPSPSSDPTSPPPQVTLRADREVVAFGRSVTLSGRTEPAAPGSIVEIRTSAGDTVGTAATDGSGRFSFEFEPTRNVRLVAVWTTVSSDPLRVGVTPRVRTHLYDVALFGRALIKGRVEPAVVGQEVRVTLRRNGDAYRRRSVRVDSRGRYRLRLRIGKPGRYRAVARYGRPALLNENDGSESRSTALPSLSVGSRGASVKRLERRLLDLGYYLPAANRYYGVETRDAVIAFNKVQARARVGDVEASTWRALASPRRAQPRVRSDFHIEIDQTRQVILVVRKGKVRWILHTSTGANGYTHDGVYRVYRKLAGTSGGGLYYPSYFDGRRAIHGWKDVPTYPASHGCARIPMWSAQWMHGIAKMGTEIRVYH